MVAGGIDFTFEFAWISDGAIRDDFISQTQTNISIC